MRPSPAYIPHSSFPDCAGSQSRAGEKADNPAESANIHGAKALAKLMQHRDIWKASSQHNDNFGIDTGFKHLNDLLAGRGWPTRGLTEILYMQSGIGELRLLTPALATLSQTQNRWLVFIDPPYIPYAPAFSNAGVNLAQILIIRPETERDRLWAMEKALGSKSCAAVLAWQDKLDGKQLRRLQVASKTGHCLGLLYRPVRYARQPSPAELRLQVAAVQRSALNDHTQLNVSVLKRKGGWPVGDIRLELADNLN